MNEMRGRPPRYFILVLICRLVWLGFRFVFLLTCVRESQGLGVPNDVSGDPPLAAPIVHFWTKLDGFQSNYSQRKR